MYEPEVLQNRETKFCYGYINGAVKEMTIVHVDREGNEIASYPLNFVYDTKSFEGVLPFSHGDLYRLRILYHDNRCIGIIDPAASYLPNGVRAWGERAAVGMVWDQAEYKFQYSKPQYVRNCRRIVEEIHIGTFTLEGTFKAAKERLAFLAENGVTDIQVLPLNAAPGEFNWGYDGSNWYAVSDNYGTPDDFKMFIDEAHRLGMRVILDVVYNHTGSEASYQEALFGNIRSNIGGSPWGSFLDFTNRGFREFTLCNAENWVRNFNLDGLRIDAMWAIKDDTSDEHIIHELVRRCRKIEPNLITVFETNEDLEDEPRLWKDLSAGGFGNSDKDRLYRNNDWFVEVVLRYFPKEKLFDWMKQVNEHTLAYSAERLNNLRTGSQKSFFDHDHIGNIYPFKRLSGILIEAYGEETGLTALRSILTISLITAGDLLIFQGDWEGILSSPFPYFRRCLAESAQRELRKGRLRENGELIIHDTSDLKRLLQSGGFEWDGSAEQLNYLASGGEISAETVQAVLDYDAGSEKLFQAAKIKEDEFNSELSYAWRGFVKKVCSFAADHTPCKKIYASEEIFFILDDICDLNGERCFKAVCNMTNQDQVYKDDIAISDVVLRSNIVGEKNGELSNGKLSLTPFSVVIFKK